MNNFSINIDESSELDFSIDINASRSNKIPQENIEVRFVIEHHGISHSFKAERKSNLYTVEIPKLDAIVTEGEMPCRLEVICNDRYFVPWKSKVSLERNYKVEAVMESKQTKQTVSAEMVPNVSPKVRTNRPPKSRLDESKKVAPSKTPKRKKPIGAKRKKKMTMEENLVRIFRGK